MADVARDISVKVQVLHSVRLGHRHGELDGLGSLGVVQGGTRHRHRALLQGGQGVGGGHGAGGAGDIVVDLHNPVLAVGPGKPLVGGIGRSHQQVQVHGLILGQSEGGLLHLHLLQGVFILKANGEVLGGCGVVHAGDGKPGRARLLGNDTVAIRGLELRHIRVVGHPHHVLDGGVVGLNVDLIPPFRVGIMGGNAHVLVSQTVPPLDVEHLRIGHRQTGHVNALGGGLEAHGDLGVIRQGHSEGVHGLVLGKELQAVLPIQGIDIGALSGGHLQSLIGDGDVHPVQAALHRQLLGLGAAQMEGLLPGDGPAILVQLQVGDLGGHHLQGKGGQLLSHIPVGVLVVHIGLILAHRRIKLTAGGNVDGGGLRASVLLATAPIGALSLGYALQHKPPLIQSGEGEGVGIVPLGDAPVRVVKHHRGGGGHFSGGDGDGAHGTTGASRHRNLGASRLVGHHQAAVIHANNVGDTALPHHSVGGVCRGYRGGEPHPLALLQVQLGLTQGNGLGGNARHGHHHRGLHRLVGLGGDDSGALSHSPDHALIGDLGHVGVLTVPHHGVVALLRGHRSGEGLGLSHHQGHFPGGHGDVGGGDLLGQQLGDNLGLLIHLLLGGRPIHRHLQRLLIDLGVGINLGLGQLGQAGHQLVLVDPQSTLSALCGRRDVVGGALGAVLNVNEANHFSRLYLVLVAHLDTVHKGPPGFFTPVHLAHRLAIVWGDSKAV